jgi:hypothetical protein
VVRSRFGRRLLFMFVTCAIVPLTVLAVLSFRQVTRQLDEQSRVRLAQAGRAMGMAVYDRLTFLDAELRRLRPAELLKAAGSGALAGLDEQSVPPCDPGRPGAGSSGRSPGSPRCPSTSPGGP